MPTERTWCHDLRAWNGLARQAFGEMGHAVFNALARRVRRLELAGEPQRALNNINRSWARIGMRAVS